ncbi:hypothetical protein FI667_g17697, partial [Globisporangium splendens]
MAPPGLGRGVPAAGFFDYIMTVLPSAFRCSKADRNPCVASQVPAAGILSAGSLTSGTSAISISSHRVVETLLKPDSTDDRSIELYFISRLCAIGAARAATGPVHLVAALMREENWHDLPFDAKHDGEDEVASNQQSKQSVCAIWFFDKQRDGTETYWSRHVEHVNVNLSKPCVRCRGGVSARITIVDEIGSLAHQVCDALDSFRRHAGDQRHATVAVRDEEIRVERLSQQLQHRQIGATWTHATSCVIGRIHVDVLGLEQQQPGVDGIHLTLQRGSGASPYNPA